MKNIASVLAVVSAVSVLSLQAQEDDILSDIEGASTSSTEETTEAETSEAAPEEAASGDDEADALGDAVGALSGKSKDKYFHILPYCRRIEGKAEVLRPGAKDWEPIQEGKFYALGTAYRTSGADTKLLIKFGQDFNLTIDGEAAFGTRAQPLGVNSRTITLVSGTIELDIPRSLPPANDIFVVTAPGFKVKNLAGKSRYSYTRKSDGDEAIVRCVTGSLSLDGRHYSIPSMRAANEIRIRTSQDFLFTGLYGLRGDVLVRLDQGRFLVKDYETGENKIDDRILDWKLSPQTAVRIHRAMPAIGERMSVTVMTFDAAGQLKNRCAFSEKRPEVNSGELGPTSKKDQAEIAKKAAEVTEAAAAETTTTEDASDSGDSAKSTDDEF